MSSRVFLLLGLLAAIVLLLASDAAARDLAETTSTKMNDANGVEEAKYAGGAYGQYPGGGYGGGLAKGCRHGCCKRGKFKYAKCIKCCASAAEAAQMATEVKPQN